MFDTHYLDQSVSNADPVIHQFMTAHADEVEGTSDDDPIKEIERLMPSLMLARRSSMAELSKMLGYSEPTLRRKLLACGTSFTSSRGSCFQRCTAAVEAQHDINHRYI